jgi:hypothetical protein
MKTLVISKDRDDKVIVLAAPTAYIDKLVVCSFGLHSHRRTELGLSCLLYHFNSTVLDIMMLKVVLDCFDCS